MLSQVTSGVHVRLRWPMVAAVVFMHAVALGALTEVTRSGRDPHGVQHTPPVITGFIIEERPTLAPDLADDGGRWPVFAPAAVDAGLCAAFAFPIEMGSITVGVLEFYRVGIG